MLLMFIHTLIKLKLFSQNTISRKNKYVWIKCVATRQGFNKKLFKIAINCGIINIKYKITYMRKYK